MTFTAEGAELIGRYTDPGPGSPFTVNEIVVRAKPLGGGRYDAPILWRWTDGRSEWRQNTITVTGDQYSQTGADSCTQTMTRVGGDGGRREVFDHPQMNGAMVDWCVTWATSCGQGGADNFCRIKGYERAESFQTDKPGRTYVIGDNKFCEGDFCDGFSQVVCVGTAPAGGTGAGPGGTDLGGEPLIGSWKGCDGRVIEFKPEGGELIGRYTALGGLGACAFSIGEVGYRATRSEVVATSSKSTGGSPMAKSVAGRAQSPLVATSTPTMLPIPARNP